MHIRYIHDEIVHNSRAAEIILPLFFEKYKPSSILDVGCGLGNWLEVAARHGVSDITGVDGAYVDRKLLKITEDHFIEAELNETISLNRKYDLVICLEVAEHLFPDSAEKIIQSLVRHSDVILFSAALPGQGGQNHLNEQWPAYWQEIFEKYGFVMVDYFRPLIWNNTNIELWYKQNLFLVVKKGHVLENIGTKNILSLIHPELFEIKIRKMNSLQKKFDRLKKRDLVTIIRQFIS